MAKRTDPLFWEKLKLVARQMRREPTAAENALWQRLRGRQLHNVKFRRQHPIDRFVVDFYCEQHKLIVEIDGSVHQYTAEEDAIRQEYLESLGLAVLRFSNDNVFQDLDAVVSAIKAWLSSPPESSSPPSPSL